MADEPWAKSRYDLQQARSPDAPDTATFNDPRGDVGWIHSYETGSTLDGPGVRVVVFMSGCLLRCLYCHNPDTWHLKDGTRVSFERARTALQGYAAALRAMGGGLTISGGEPLVQMHFTKRLFAAAKEMGLHTALDTSGFLGARADDEYLRQVDLVLLDIKSWDPATYRRAVGQDIKPTLKFAERLAALDKPV
jgi:pyruvate formate lyase activating enzyme